MPSSRGRSRAGGHGLRGLGPAAPVQAPGEYRAGHGEQEAGDQALQNQPHLRAPVGALQGLADAAGEGGARGGAQPRIAQRHPAQGVGAPQRVPLCEKWERVCARFGWRDMIPDNGLSSNHTCAGRAGSAQARSKTLKGKPPAPRRPRSLSTLPTHHFSSELWTVAPLRAVHVALLHRLHRAPCCAAFQVWRVRLCT